ncbi:MAG: urea transporter, partial [Lentisphaerae bacterium]|nr:urea transporter [Lentisphaerota bacterium]
MRDTGQQVTDEAAEKEGSRPSARDLVDSVLHSYSAVFFTRSRWLGAVLLGATFLAPRFGAIGLGCLLIAMGVAYWVGFDRTYVRDGSYLFNSMLAGFAIAYLYNYQPLGTGVLLLLMVSFSVLALFVTVVMGNVFHRQFGLPAMSLPFVVVALLMFFLFFSVTRTPITSEPPWFLVPEPDGLPNGVTCFLQAFGAIFFLPHSWVGAVVLVGLLLHSRLALVYAVTGFAAGMLFLGCFNVDTTPAAVAYVSFNFAFSAIALGGIFFVPSRSSLLMAVLGSFFCAAMAIAVQAFLRYFGIPPMALPFNIVVLLVVYAMRMRTRARGLHVTPFAPLAPEMNFRKFTVERRRFPDLGRPAILPPFFGERVVTQGFNGTLTHRGLWRYALDFEVIDDAGLRFSGPGSRLESYHSYNTPVVAPGNGTVVAVVKHVRDNTIGESNMENNWGNLVVLRLQSGLHVTLCHLRPDGITIKPNDEVTAGTLLGYSGNSGRSPVPHLHLQLQASPLAGAATLPFRLRHYLEQDNEEWRYRTSGIPREGSRIRSVT